MNNIIGITLCIYSIILISYLIFGNKKIIKLSTYTYNYELAYSIFKKNKNNIYEK